MCGQTSRRFLRPKLGRFQITSGLLVSFLLYQFQLGENLRELGEVWNGLMQAVGASRKVFDLIDRVPRVHNDGRIAPDGRNAKIEGRIEFRNVSFSYPTRPDVQVMQVCRRSSDERRAKRRDARL